MLLGPLPTPGVAYLTRALRRRPGVVISASHNPYADNGIKFFSGRGDQAARRLGAARSRRRWSEPPPWATRAKLGKARRLDDAAGRYIEFCKSTFPNELSLEGPEDRGRLRAWRGLSRRARTCSTSSAPR